MLPFSRLFTSVFTNTQTRTRARTHTHTHTHAHACGPPRYVWTDGNDEEHISRGVFNAYTKRNLRYSQVTDTRHLCRHSRARARAHTHTHTPNPTLQVSPTDMFSEVNTKTNLPAQIELYATKGSECKFQFMAKGGVPHMQFCVSYTFV